MEDALKPQTSAANGALWGARARDWADIQEGTMRPAFDAVLEAAAIGDGAAYLDAGCGSGMAASIAAARGARVAGVDAAKPLLEIARERVPNGDFRVADLETLPFEDDRFHVVTLFNSVQYAGNPVRALREARRVVRRGGTVAITVWGDPATMAMASVITALGKLLPPPPPGAAGPFALSDERALRSLAESAGLTIDRVFDVTADIDYPDLATALRGLDSSGVAERARSVAGEEAVSQAHREALAPFRTASGGYRIGGAFRSLIAAA
jgi:SAM-dependent methyltransferase